MRLIEKALYILLLSCAIVMSVRTAMAIDLPDRVNGVSATDGTINESVVVSWNPSVGATSYKVYRATGAFIQGKPLTTTVDTFFEDRSAVPGKWYFYRVVAINAAGSAPTSLGDRGHRSASIEDLDGDLDEDSQELAWGSNPYDPGDNNEKLLSPTYAALNGFLEQNIFLELIADGNVDVLGSITILDIDGKPLHSFPFFLPAGHEQDFDVKQWAKDDSYGMIRIDFNKNDGASLSGRVSSYLPSVDGQSFSFANARELSRTLRGEAFTITNSMNPNGGANAQPVWLELGNASESAQNYDVSIYDITGKLISNTPVSLDAQSSVHLPGGHQFGQGVYLAQVTAKDGALPFIFAATRYGISEDQNDLNYSFATQGRSGSSGPIFVHTSNLDGACWNEWNWVEIANVIDSAVDVTAIIRNSFGYAYIALPIRINAKSQAHLDISSYLPKGMTGYVELVASVPGSIVMNSSVYVRDCEKADLQTAYVFEQATPGAADQIGNFNFFLDNKNTWAVINTAAQFEVALFRTGSIANPTSQEASLLSSNQGHSKLVGGEIFAQSNQNSLGLAILSSSSERTLVGHIVRKRELADGRLDYVIPTKLH